MPTGRQFYKGMGPGESFGADRASTDHHALEVFDTAKTASKPSRCTDGRSQKPPRSFSALSQNQ
jgi:hypothetical protein